MFLENRRGVQRNERILISVISLCAVIVFAMLAVQVSGADSKEGEKKYIKWVEFDVCYSALQKALDEDIATHNQKDPIPWTETLAYLGAKYGGDFSRYKPKDMDAYFTKRREGQTQADITADMEYYNYYYKAYSAVLGGLVGSYAVELEDENGNKEIKQSYGLKAFSPIAQGYSYSHYEDFGNSRSYGFKRKHLGNDLLGSIGTPITAVESGIVECIGWNQYGGWRIGIRSFDKKRYYYYAHLRKDHPYAAGLQEGQVVTAGDVIGYLGMTGYSTQENVNGMNVPHLHFGLQLIFDESQKEGNNEIWVDVYDLVELLEQHRTSVYKQEKEYYRKYPFTDPSVLNYTGG
ncbi:MAG TPA: M23 family metallopeptidase [Firmicutes bacterium]|nr:M23 family metallopeptidase [Bacillota bacterium]